MLKLERVQGDDTTNNLLGGSAEICSLVVSHSELSVPWVLKNEVIDTVKVLKRSDFDSLNVFKEFKFSYRFADSSRNSSYSYLSRNSKGIQFRRGRGYIQYKVYWLGNSNYTLSLDKILVYDTRGEEVLTNHPLFTSRINEQLDSDFITDLPVVSWLGVDEPNSIDNYEPMKSLINYVKHYKNGNQKIQFPMMGQYFGVFENPNNPFGIYHISPWKEMKKRIGKVSICQNFYFLDYPYQSNYDASGDKNPCNCNDFRIRNIDLVANNYRQAYELDSAFGVSVQCGSINNEQAKQRNVDSYDLAYEINLALLFGAKYISLYTYFAQRKTDDVTGTGTNHAIVDKDPSGNFIYTDKYNMLYYKIAPRLSGLFGKTIRNLTPGNQHTGSNGINFYSSNFPADLAGNLLKSVSPYLVTNETYHLDYGYFADSVGNNFIMIINRYNSKHDLFKIELKNLSAFQNWKILSHTDSVIYYVNTINGGAEFADTLDKGEAALYSIKPVALFGGNLLSSEYLSGESTLKEDNLYIKSGATLTVDGIYNIYKNIVVEAGGQLTLTSNGTLNFYNGAKLKVYGSLTNAGSYNNKRIINFNNSDFGMEFYKGQTINYLSLRNTTGTAIKLDTAIQNSGEVMIKNCEFLNCGNGISAMGVSGINIVGNSFNSCTAGISFNYSTNNIIVDNSFTSCGLGIFLTSTVNNQVRHNNMNYCGHGIYLGNSSIDAGNNTIHNSEFNGIYAGPGSTLNMKALLKRIPCYNNLIFTRERGYNSIFDNVNNDIAEGDGAEIYLNNSILLADSGSNYIYDDRFGSRQFPVTNLLDGFYDYAPNQIKLSLNMWGDTTSILISERFGSLPVIYIPIGFLPEPQNAQGCSFVNISASGQFIIDTIYADQGGEGPDFVTYIKELYLSENEYRIAENYEASESVLKIIISMFLNDNECSEAFSLLYSNYEEREASSEEFLSLGDYYNSLLNTCINEANYEIIAHFVELCSMQGGMYQSAMLSFQNTIDQYPGTERAALAELDLYTAAYFDTTQSLGKSMVKVNSEDLNKKLNELMLRKLGKFEGKTAKFIPTEYNIFQNYPNPFNPVTTIQYDIPQRSEVKIKIFDLLGREITALVNEIKEQGRYTVQFNASNLSSGVYFYQISAGKYNAVKKMVFLK